MYLNFLVLILFLFVAILILHEHEKKKRQATKPYTIALMKRRKAFNYVTLRRLYLKALRENKRCALHRWLNEIEGDIKIGHVWIARQYVLFQKPLPYPVPSLPSLDEV